MRRAGTAVAFTVFCVLGFVATAGASSGEFERTWGKDVLLGGGTGSEICTTATTCTAGVSGGLGGEFKTPESSGVDAAGNIYVADYGNQRIQKFDSSGNFELAWGKDVVTGGGTGFEICTVAANCKAGTVGGLGGEFSNVSGAAADASGNIYVTDQGNQRIQKFDSSGNFQRAWGRDVVTGGATGFEICTVAANCQNGGTGGLGGELSSPIGLATDSVGDVYVADFANQRIQKFDASGNFQRAWGKDVDLGAASTGFEVCSVAVSCKPGVGGGGLGGEFNGPLLPAADASGNVYVSDASNNRIQVFNASGGFKQAWGKDVDTAGGTGFEICTEPASCKAGATGGLGGELNQPFGTSTDAAGNVYVSDYLNQRIQKFFEPMPPEQPPAEPPPATPPDNSFAIGKVSGKKVAVTVPGAGQIAVTDAAAGKRKVLLKPSSATAAAAGSVDVTLKLTKPGKKKLKQKGKVKVSAEITFTPTGGSANSQNKTLKIKKRKK